MKMSGAGVTVRTLPIMWKAVISVDARWYRKYSRNDPGSASDCFIEQFFDDDKTGVQVRLMEC